MVDATGVAGATISIPAGEKTGAFLLAPESVGRRQPQAAVEALDRRLEGGEFRLR